MDNTLQSMIQGLNDYFSKNGCIIEPAYDFPVGAGTFYPVCFFGSLNKDDMAVAYVAPSRRPKDGRYGENPIRWQRFFQYQVLYKPPLDDIQRVYLNSLSAIGIPINKHDIRFVEDDWESPSLGATGLGWQVWLDGIEISQFTYFQRMGGQKLDRITVELTYGLERIAIFLQGAKSMKDISLNEGFKYGSTYLQMEKENCKFNFEEADIDLLRQHYLLWKVEARRLLGKRLLYPAYDLLLCQSHYFNILDARGALGVKERQGFIQEIRGLARDIAEAYLKGLKEEEGIVDLAEFQEV